MTRREEWRKSREVSLVPVLPRLLDVKSPEKRGNHGTSAVNFIFDHLFCSFIQQFIISFILSNNVFIAR